MPVMLDTGLLVSVIAAPGFNGVTATESGGVAASARVAVKAASEGAGRDAGCDLGSDARSDPDSDVGSDAREAAVAVAEGAGGTLAGYRVSSGSSKRSSVGDAIPPLDWRTSPKITEAAIPRLPSSLIFMGIRHKTA